MNNVTLIGRLTRDPEHKTIGEHEITTFTIAINHNKTDTSFIDIEAWNKTGNVVQEHSGQGCRVGIEGSLKQQSWEKDGQKRSKIIVNAYRVEIIDWAAEEQAIEEAAAAGALDDVPF